MSRTLVIFFLSIFVVFSIAQDKTQTDRSDERKLFGAAEVLFDYADRLSEKAGDDPGAQEFADIAYRKALQTYGTVITGSRESGFDSLLVLAGLKSGLIHYYLGEIPQAKAFYLEAFRLRPRAPLEDSAYFMHLVFTGAIYHGNNEYDSALHFYNMAREVQEKYDRPLEGSERLFNRLGVILYENGNFRQARNYFEKAIELTGNKDLALITNYRINIASILVKLDELDSARVMYEKALSSGHFSNEINHNLAIIHLRSNRPGDALKRLRSVTYPEDRKVIDLNYNYALAFQQLGEKDSSEYYYQKGVAENTRWNSERKNIPYGLLLKFKADQLKEAGQAEQALSGYQAAILQFHTGFTNADIRSNPEDFSEAFSYINLFQSLTAKGAAFEDLYEKTKNNDDLVSSLDAYESAFRLAHYIERTYESDESRLFLNRIKHSAHSRPIDVCTRLYALTEEKRFLETAYMFDQRNKASVLRLNMQENELRLQATDPLLKDEARLRSQLTRLSLKATTTTDPEQLANLTSQVRDLEIGLGQIQDELSRQPEYRDKMLLEEIPAVRDVQRKFDNRTALISWHLAERSLLALIIRGNKFTHKVIPVDSNFIPLLNSFRRQLEKVDALNKYEGEANAKKLYNLLFKPLVPDLYKADRLIIIPDDELSYLPFEALQDQADHFVVEKYSVQYHFSTHFVTRPVQHVNQKGTLAFAPFAKRGFSENNGETFVALPASFEEVRDLKGTVLIDSIGTKQNFLASANKYGTLHLATHADVNDSVPGLSYIAFFPSNEDYRLYSREIYDLRLDSTDLVILSACRTGMGRLVKGEGLMSLSRAFAFAGCPNIIMSLWMAEDKTTSFITRRLHEYLEEGYTKDEALQMSKKDLLKDKNIDPRFKTPNYWAHLMYIGEYEKQRAKKTWLWVVGVFIVLAVAYVILKKTKIHFSQRRKGATALRNSNDR